MSHSPSLSLSQSVTVRPLGPLAGPFAPPVVIRVAGLAKTQGSKVARHAGGKSWVQEVNAPAHKLWRHAVNDEARKAWAGRPPLVGSVALTIVFDIQPPKSQTRRERLEGPVKARSGDLDKLARSVLDSLTGVCFLDDSQVRPLIVDKVWAGPEGPGVTITIELRDDPE